MLAEIENLTKRHQSAKSELDMAQDTARTYYQRMVQAESDKTQLQTYMDCDKFVLVLIDGDSMPFMDTFIARGTAGGEEAGKLLRNAVLEHHRTNAKYHADDRVIIRTYTNARGLARTYKTLKVIPDESVLDAFIAGFNRSHPLSDYIDAGSHKEAADSKLKANFELYYRNFHCQHIIFGGSADNSYAGFLSPYSFPHAVNDRITLLEGHPFPADLRRVAQGFRHASFPSILRSTKLQVAPAATQSLPTGLKRPATDILTPVRDRSSPQGTNGTAASAISAVKAKSAPPTPHPLPAALPGSPHIYQNQYGQRLDVPLSIDRDYLKFLYGQNWRLCNNYYLKGFCPHGANCEWNHTQTLNQLQLDTFRHKARSSSCRSAFCVDPQCCHGHMCPRGASCNINSCKFLPEMHNIDVNQIYQVNTDTNEKKRVSLAV